MNKQEGLEAMLVECRKYEARATEAPAETAGVVLGSMVENVQTLHIVLEQQPSRRRTARVRQLLAQVGGEALYLLRDEVEVVDGADAGQADSTSAARG